MSQKNIAAVLLLIATALGGPPAVDHAINVHEEVLTSVAIEGPSEVAVGELVELTVTGTRPSWLPPTADAKDLGDTLVLSFRDEGTYEVIASAIAGQKTQTVKHVIEVAKYQSVLVDDEPTPAPDVPEPVPTPEPDDGTDSGGDLTKSVHDWCVEAKTDRAVAKQLGDNFIYAASRAESIDELLQLVAQRNRKVNQRTASRVLAKIQQHLYDNLAGEGFTEHQCAFDEIGQGFLRYAGGDTGSPGTGNPGFWHGE